MSGPNITCPYHPSAILIESHHAGDMVCSSCGLVVGDRVVDVGSEWRTFSDSVSDPSRVGAAENPLFENDLTTRIGPSTSYQNQSRSSVNRTLISAYRDINELAEKANLPKTIIDEAATLFKKVHEQRRLRNRPRLTIVAACIYLSCRLQKVPRSLKELSAITNVPTCMIAKCFTAICKSEPLNQSLSTHVDSGDFLSRFCSNLNLPNDVQRIAMHIASVVKDKSIADGRNPTSIAAAAIFMASQISDTKKTQKEISEVAGVADSTIRQTYRLMLNRAIDLIPMEYHSRIDGLPTS